MIAPTIRIVRCRFLIATRCISSGGDGCLKSLRNLIDCAYVGFYSGDGGGIGVWPFR